ncbi:uncharacterized protein TM35_000122940 [Trypanosoma theileri]|uniref:Uncharacterized protein n=1 Tax=Trypanosoma theileri TaxID=67003 RepID=A0A1X0NZ89_9TRYP|nr:uncharacterized protein TM35_000122940 [Trypanosoma theileri]ORC89519.1 hypothetical protein TM35_000122940 [Trypanosoma theileri]
MLRGFELERERRWGGGKRMKPGNQCTCVKLEARCRVLPFSFLHPSPEEGKCENTTHNPLPPKAGGQLVSVLCATGWVGGGGDPGGVSPLMGLGMVENSVPSSSRHEGNGEEASLRSTSPARLRGAMAMQANLLLGHMRQHSEEANPHVLFIEANSTMVECLWH